MKKTLFSLAAILCLLTIFVGSASCMIATQPRQAACDHCPKHTPMQQHTTSCCTAHHQPASDVTFAGLQQPALSSTLELPSLRLDPAAAVLPLARLDGPPHFPPRIALRI